MLRPYALLAVDEIRPHGPRYVDVFLDVGVLAGEEPVEVLRQERLDVEQVVVDVPQYGVAAVADAAVQYAFDDELERVGIRYFGEVDERVVAKLHAVQLAYEVLCLLVNFRP